MVDEFPAAHRSKSMEAPSLPQVPGSPQGAGLRPRAGPRRHAGPEQQAVPTLSRRSAMGHQMSACVACVSRSKAIFGPDQVHLVAAVVANLVSALAESGFEVDPVSSRPCTTARPYRLPSPPPARTSTDAVRSSKPRSTKPANKQSTCSNRSSRTSPAIKSFGLPRSSSIPTGRVRRGWRGRPRAESKPRSRPPGRARERSQIPGERQGDRRGLNPGRRHSASWRVPEATTA